MQWLLILKLVVLLTVANGAPVIATKLFGNFLNRPLDLGASFVDGRPILGGSKTVRGSSFHLWRLRPLRQYSGLSGYRVSS